MKINVKETVYSILIAIAFSAVLFGMFMYGTSAECWYSGQHDKNCECMLYNQENCHCCERLCAAEKEIKK